MARSTRSGRALDIKPCIQAVRDSLDRFEAENKRGRDLVGPSLDLQIVMEDLQDAVDRNEGKS